MTDEQIAAKHASEKSFQEMQVRANEKNAKMYRDIVHRIGRGRTE